MTKFRDGLIGPTVILLAICIVITYLLALTYKVTKPIIEAGAGNAANAVFLEVLPDATSFEELDASALPDGITRVMKSDAGYVFESGATGFNGIVTYMIGIDNDGNVTGINLFAHSETPGLGTKVGEPDYIANYLGQVDPDSVDAVTGATVTTNSLKNSLKNAKAAFETVKGAS